jgi:hypothetical protein
MSARRLGRLLGSLLVLAAIVVSPLVDVPTVVQADFEWTMSALTQVSVR